MRRIRIIGAGLAALAVAGSAVAADSYWTHNGSRMLLIANGPERIFRYKDPRPGLQALGIADSSILFVGRRDGDRISGTAYVFAPGCAPAPYAVAGTLRSETRIVLEGEAPQRRTEGCEVERLTANSPHARLVFDYESRAE